MPSKVSKREAGLSPSAYRAAIRPDSLSARAIYERARARHKAGQLDEAFAGYSALDDVPNVPERLCVSIGLDRGATYALAGKLNEAIDEYSEGLVWQGLDEPTRAAVLVKRGTAHWKLEHVDEVLADMTEVIEAPDMPRDQRINAIVTRAEFYLGLGRLQEAETQARSVVEAFGPTPNEAASAHLNSRADLG